MNETEFHALADKTLAAFSDTLEGADADGAVELEYQAGVLSIDLPNKKQLLVSKHAPTRQLWLSSPVSGGLHFSHNGTGWALPDGRTLPVLLAQELKTLAGVEVTL